MQCSNVTPKVNRLNYIKIFLNIVDNKIEENYLSKIFVQSSVGNLNLYSQDSIYKRNLKNVMQCSNVTPEVNRLNYIKIFLNIVDNKIEENYLSKIFVQSSVGNLNLYSQDSIYKRKNMLNTEFEYIGVTFLNEDNEVISFKDFFSISLFIQ